MRPDKAQDKELDSYLDERELRRQAQEAGFVSTESIRRQFETRGGEAGPSPRLAPELFLCRRLPNCVRCLDALEPGWLVIARSDGGYTPALGAGHMPTIHVALRFLW